MRLNRFSLKFFALATTLLAGWMLNAPAQTAPGITTQPASQLVTYGSNIVFTVGVSGPGPFTYQWSCNGTNLPNNLITTVAGKGSATYSGDNGPATNANIYNPEGLAFDAAGNLYIADHENHRIRKVATNGIITTVAGNGTGGYLGDGVAATSTSLYAPAGVSFDSAGNLFIADQGNSRIRKVATNGIITTVAGNGTNGFAGDGGAATNAKLNNPYDVRPDPAGRLFLSDSSNYRLRRVDTNGVITTLTTGGYPLGLALDPAGNLYAAVSTLVRQVATNGVASTFAGGGSSGDGGAATNASLSWAFNLAFDSSGNLLVSDFGNNNIRRVDTNGAITTVAANGTLAYAGDSGATTNAGFSAPTGLAFDPAGNLYVSDMNNNRVREIHLAGLPALTFTNLSYAKAGNYAVVIANAFGSVTSSVATLTILAPTNAPRIYSTGTGFGFATNCFGFNFSGLAGQTIVIDASTNLTTWTPLFTNSATGTNAVSFSDPVSSNFPARYYRARLP